MVGDEAPAAFPPCRTPCDSNITINTYGKDKKVCFYHMGPQVAYHAPAEMLVPKFAGFSIGRILQVFRLDSLRKVIYPVTNTKLAMVAVALLSTTSTGSVGLDSIDPQCLSTEDDAETLVDAFGDLLEVLKKADMKVAVPGFDMNPPDRQALVTSTRMSAAPFWHLAGSCAMGKSKPLLALATTFTKVFEFILLTHLLLIQARSWTRTLSS